MDTELDRWLQAAAVSRSGVDIRSSIKQLVAFSTAAAATKSDFITYLDAAQIAMTLSVRAVADRLAQLDDARPLTEVAGEEGIRQIRRAILVAIGGLPHDYEFHFRLPGLEDAGPAVTLAPGITLATLDDIRDFGFTKNAGLGGPLLNALRQIDDGVPIRGVVLSVKSQGYFSGSEESSAFRAALSQVKQFIALGVAEGALSLRSKFLSESLIAQAVGHALKENSRVAFALSAPLSRMLTKVEFSNRLFSRQVNLLAAALRGEADGNPAMFPREEWPPILQGRLGGAAGVAANQFEPKVIQSLRMAAEWTFNSWAEENETTAFIFSAIAIEAIFRQEGDEQGRITARLADRLSFLLGKDPAQRIEMQQRFKEFYNTRGKIVHGTVAQLHNRHVTDLEWGRETLKRVLRTELSNVPNPPRP